MRPALKNALEVKYGAYRDIAAYPDLLTSKTVLKRAQKKLTAIFQAVSSFLDGHYANNLISTHASLAASDIGVAAIHDYNTISIHVNLSIDDMRRCSFAPTACAADTMIIPRFAQSVNGQKQAYGNET